MLGRTKEVAQTTERLLKISKSMRSSINENKTKFIIMLRYNQTQPIFWLVI